jgi:hypothetical protein
MVGVRDLQLVRETVRDLEAQGEKERAMALENVLGVAMVASESRATRTPAELLTISQVMKIFGVSRPTIKRWLATDQLEGVTIAGRTLISWTSLVAQVERLLASPSPSPANPAGARPNAELSQFVTSGLSADKLARLEALQEKVFDGHQLSSAEDAEATDLAQEITAASTRLTAEWVMQARPAR